ncbi:MAG TPA: VOC family protein [Mycobacteriales bacterium]|nr:VOC family protein [Mycobacteriales bacterium]
MSDPFDSLRARPPRIDPDPGFARRLRARLERAILDEPAGGTTMNESVHSLTPYLAVTDGRAALDWYVEVFGARRRAEPIVMQDGRIGHAEIAIGDSVLMLAEEFPEIGHTAPDVSGGGASLRVEVPDVDVVIGRARDRGGELLRPAGDSGHGYAGTIRDPFGYRWIVSAAAPAPEGPRHGEVGYFTFEVPDDAAARAFYGAVLGWRFSPGRVEHGWNLEGTGLPMAGLHGGQESGGWRPLFAVDDLPAAIEQVRERGGQPGEITREPYGLTADCVDDQGLRFWLWQAVS